MKIFSIALLLVSFIPVSADSNDPPDLKVIKSSWGKSSKRIDDTDAASSRSKTDDIIEERKRFENVIRNPDPSISSEYERKRRESEQGLPPSAQRDGYRYRVTLENTGKKTIKAVYWDYVFSDPESGQELDRHQFYSREKIAPGKKKELSEFAYSPPSRVVSLDAANKKDEPQFKESIVINRIEYTDGVVWQR